MKRKLLKYIILTIILLVVTEVLLRLLLDNGQRALYMQDPFCEYRLLPNQDLTRFHNSYRTNTYGMRSGPVNKNDWKRILLFGDSVLNGGSKIDQEDLINYRLEEDLENKYDAELGVYNVSAGSWGPENAYRFFEHYVDFDIDIVVLVFGSEDYHDNMHFRNVVGVEPAWPDKQPFLAIGDLWSGFIVPKISSWFGNRYDYLQGFDDSAVNPGWDLFTGYAARTGKPLFVYHHPTMAELETGQFNAEGVSLEEKLYGQNIPVVNGLAYAKPEHYLDNIHINHRGHAEISKAIFSFIVGHSLLNEVH